MRYYLLTIAMLIFLNGCSVGHKDFVDIENRFVGKKTSLIKPFKFKNSGQFTRGDFEIAGYGITHVTKDKDGNLIVHWYVSEILPNAPKKEWVGKCLLYEVVDPKTHIIKGWGYDEGGNPLSCRTWP